MNNNEELKNIKLHIETMCDDHMKSECGIHTIDNVNIQVYKILRGYAEALQKIDKLKSPEVTHSGEIDISTDDLIQFLMDSQYSYYGIEFEKKDHSYCSREEEKPDHPKDNEIVMALSHEKWNTGESWGWIVGYSGENHIYSDEAQKHCIDNWNNIEKWVVVYDQREYKE